MENKPKIGDLCKVKIRKFDPSLDTEPYYIEHKVPYTREMRVLEVLDYVVEELGDSIAYQWYCGAKKCGGCGMKVNGKPVLACWEPAQREMIVEPLDNLPLLRDLVIDRTQYEENLILMDPTMLRGELYQGFPEYLTPEMMGYAPEMMHCIDCLICLSVCPAYDDEFEYVGPAPLVKLARYALDPRDDGPRGAIAVDEGSLKGCVSCYECTENCPTGINVLEHAIDQLRILAVEERLGVIAHHNKIYRELIMEQGIVNPSTLLVRSMRWRVFGEIDLAIRMWLKKRISLTKLLHGLVKMERLNTQDELIALGAAVKYEENQKVEE